MNKLPLNIHCPHFKLCSGCSINEFVDSPPVLEEARQFFKQRGTDIHLHAGNAAGWRLRAKLAIRGTPAEPLIGLFKEGTHDVVDIPFCKVHHPAINQAVEFLRELIKEEKIQPYNETNHTGELRYVQIIVERSSNRVQLSFVWNSKGGPLEKEQRIHRLEKIWEKHGQKNFWHSIWINFNTRRDNVIFGEEWLLLKGEPLLWEKFGKVEVCFHPASFAQANMDLFERMLHSLRRFIPDNDRVVEFYAGVGVIGLSLAEKCLKIECCEVVPEAEKCFEKSKARLTSDIAEKIKFHLGSAAKMIHLLEDARTVIVDPPRKGLDRPLLKAMQETGHLKRLIYISCGWTAFQRDCDALLSHGWRLNQAEAYLFFPGSNHIEILACFETNLIPKVENVRHQSATKQ